MTEVLLYNGKLNPYLCNEYEIIQRRLVIQWPFRVTAVQPFMHGVTAVYRTAEHAFQAMRASDLNSARQMESPRGRFDDAGAVLAKWPLGEEDKTEVRTVHFNTTKHNSIISIIKNTETKLLKWGCMAQW